MKSTYEIIWTENAVKELENTIQYLETNWTKKEISNLFLKLEEILALISTQPSIYLLVSRSKNIHNVPILKYNTLYYKIENKKVFILREFAFKKLHN